MKKFLGAFVIFLSISSLNSFNNSAMKSYRKGLNLLKRNKYNKAFLHFKNAIKLDKTLGWAYRWAGYTLIYKLNNPYLGIKYIKSGENFLKDDYYAYIYLANAYNKLKKYKKTLSSYKKAIKLYLKKGLTPPSWIPVNIGLIYKNKLNQPDYTKAIRFFKLSFKYKPNKKIKLITYKYLSHSYLKLKKLSKALYWAKKAGKKFWIFKYLCPRKYIYSFNIPFKNFMHHIYRRVKPGIIKFQLPVDRSYQKLISVRSTPDFIRIDKVGKENLVVFNFKNDFPKWLKLQITVHLKIVNSEPKYLKTYTNKNGKIGFWANLKNSFYDIDNTELRKTVFNITKNKRTVKEKVMAIHNWVSKNIRHVMHLPRNKNKKYSEMKPRNFKTISKVFKRRLGWCNTISGLFVGMCRIIKVPARIIGCMGITNYLETSGIYNGHYVAEIYDPHKKQWVYIEPQGSPIFGINDVYYTPSSVEPFGIPYNSYYNKRKEYKNHVKTYYDKRVINFHMFNEYINIYKPENKNKYKRYKIIYDY